MTIFDYFEAFFQIFKKWYFFGFKWVQGTIVSPPGLQLFWRALGTSRLGEIKRVWKISDFNCC